MNFDLLKVLIMSAIPVLEQKAAIPFAIWSGYSDTTAYFVTWLGAVLPAPLILLFIPKVFEIMRRFPKLAKIVDWYEHGAMKRGKNIVKYELLGLFFFVAFPLPLTGVWTGSAVAALLKLDFKKALPVVVLGAAVCGLIILLAVNGVLAISWLAK